MPTAVGPNTKGEENLVFGYDLGDVSNSYKGEPTTNLVDAFPDTSLPSGLYWTYEYSASISDSPIGNHFLSDKKWVKLVKTSSTNGRVLFTGNGVSFTSGSTYTVTAYVYINDSRNTSLAFNSDNGGYSQETVDVGYNFTNIGTVQRIRGTWNQLQNGGSIYGLRGGSSNAVGSTIYMTGLQVEENGHPTQLTAGTRSATQGLLDLTGNSTIDLRDVSFDSNAQMTFDGSSDHITGVLPISGGGAPHTIEMVLSPDINQGSFGSRRDPFTIGNAATHQYSALDISPSFMNWYFYSKDTTFTNNPLLTAGNYYHFVLSYAGGYSNNTNKRVWINGVEQTLSPGPNEVSLLPDNPQFSVGRDRGRNTAYFPGEIPIFKVYDRALTEKEALANFNAIKGRFNI